MTADGKIDEFLLMLLSCSTVTVKGGIKWTEVCFWFSLEDPQTPLFLSLSLPASPPLILSFKEYGQIHYLAVLFLTAGSEGE